MKLIKKAYSFFKRCMLKFKYPEISNNTLSIATNCELSNVKFEDYVSVAHHSQISKSSIGKRTSIGRYDKIRSTQIGKYCSISWDVTIGAVAHDINCISSNAFCIRKQFGIVDKDIFLEDPITKIGNDVWIGCGAIVIAGVCVGDGAVIGAGAVVTKDVKPYEIVTGVPAKHMRYRFNEDIIEKLEHINWCNWTDEKIKNNLWLFKKKLDIVDFDNIK